MRQKLMFWAVAVTVLACEVTGMTAYGRFSWLLVSMLLVSAVALVLLYRGVVMPSRTVCNGFDILASQDFNNRLRTTGEPVSDRIARLFNEMIVRLKEERVRVREQNHFLDLLIQASPVGIAIFDLDGRVSHVNAAFVEICGVEESAMTGKPLKSIPGRMSSELAGLPSGGKRTVRIDATHIYSCHRLSFMESGLRRHFVMVEPLGEELRKAERDAYGKVIRTISHEVNNTLGGLMSFLETLEDVHEEDPAIRELAESCHDRCGNLARFIGDYADVVRIPEPSLAPVDICEEVRMLAPFARSLAGSGISLKLDIPDAPVMVMADAAQLQQVMVNIVKNAAQSVGDAGGEVSVSVSSTGESARLTVTDDGPGISEEVSRELFTPFFTTRPSGCGVGLTLAAEVLRRHGARFSLATDPATHLTSFEIIFPSVPSSPSPFLSDQRDTVRL